MASTKMFTKNGSSSNTFFHQQSSTNGGNPLMDEDTTLTQEMHVKMAKKIAQLTKVRSVSSILFVNKKKE